ncbi:MAG: SRPBCC family protein [Microbacterium sp.]|uniref:SRPBCC family protein n=1 Tax=Microbacterium sp. TaxID=51671 RepID=UPI003D6E0DAF
MTHVIAAPNEAVLRVVGDFGAEHRWTKTVDDCVRDTADVRVGTVRSCRRTGPRPRLAVRQAHGSAIHEACAARA